MDVTQPESERLKRDVEGALQRALDPSDVLPMLHRLSRAASPGRLALVQAGLESMDRADLARVAIEKEGMVSKTETTGALHVHPLVKVEREARGQFILAWKTLNLECDNSVDPRYGSEGRAAAAMRALVG